MLDLDVLGEELALFDNEDVDDVDEWDEGDFNEE